MNAAIKNGDIEPVTTCSVIRLALALECKVSALVSVFDKEDLAKLLPK